MSINQNEIKRAKVDISINGINAEIKIDGNIINGVRQFWFNAAVDKRPSLLLEIVPSKININGENIVTSNIDLESLTIEDLMQEVIKRFNVNISLVEDNKNG